MTEIEQMADSRTWVRLTELLTAVLPISNLGSLLTELASGWKDITSADAVYVWQCQPDGNSVVGSLCGHDGSLDPADFASEPPTDWSGDEVLDRLRSECGPFNEAKSTVCFSFEFDGECVGGVLVSLGSAEPPQAATATQLANVSACLIAEAVRWEANERTATATIAPQVAKLEALAEFAAGAGHEINNPVATIAGRATLLLKGETDPDRRQSLATIGGQAYRIRDMIGDAMLFARPPEPSPEELNLTIAVESVVTKLAEQAELQGCGFDLQCDSSVLIWADRVQLNVVVSSLIQNSLDAGNSGDTIRVCTKSVADQTGCNAVLTVSDNGPGLNDIEREHLFDPFFSGRQAGRGLGFGLSKCWRIITNHHGSIEVESIPDGPTTFKVLWPSAAPRDAEC